MVYKFTNIKPTRYDLGNKFEVVISDLQIRITLSIRYGLPMIPKRI